MMMMMMKPQYYYNYYNAPRAAALVRRRLLPWQQQQQQQQRHAMGQGSAAGRLQYNYSTVARGISFRRSPNNSSGLLVAPPLSSMQLPSHVHSFEPATTTTTRRTLFHGTPPLSLASSSNNNWWFPLREPEQGTGFDNFLKRQNPSDHKDKSSDKKKNKKEDDDSHKEHSSSSSGGKGSNSNNSNSNNNNGMIILATMILATIMIFSNSDSDKGDTSQGGGDNHQPSSSSSSSGAAGAGGAHLVPQLDLTWSEFLQLLEHDAIFKIVIHQGAGRSGSDGEPPTSSRAKVYLKPHYQQIIAAASEHRAIGMDDATTTAWSAAASSSSSEDPSTSTSTTTTSSSTNSKQPLVYRNLRIGSAASLERKLEEAQRALGRPTYHDIPVQYSVESGVTHELVGVIPWLLLSAFLVASFRGAAGRMGGGVGATGSSGPGGPGGMFGMGKSTAQKFTKEMNINVGFKDVAGCDEAKREIMEFVEFLQTPDRFTQLGAKIPKGALLTGPPGTGKTLLAKAVAGEAGVPFYSLAGSEFLEMFVGVGPSRVRDLFREARENAPCIIFIDEIDSIGRKRGKSSAMGGNDERENTLNQLLVEMDGFDPSTGVICLAGTNRDDILDPALTRPGRFDRKIQVDLPDIAGRKDIFKVHLCNITLVDGLEPVNDNDNDNDNTKKEKTGDTNDEATAAAADDDEEDTGATPEQQAAIDHVASRLAGLTPGFSGADIANICNEAAIVAARRNADFVTMEDFEKATDRVIGGLESNRIMSPEERKIVAYHEAGHAVAGWFLEHADPLLKVTIIPRASGALGFAQYLPKEVNLRTQDQIMDIVAMALAGRAAEEVFFGSVTTGASDDLRRVTQMVYSTIQLYGMNTRLGQLAFPKDPSAMWEERRYSEKTAKAMDEEAKAIVDKAYERTLALLREHKDDVDKVAKLLLEKETISHDHILDLIGERPFKGDKNYDEYVSTRKAEKEEKEAKESAAADGNATDDANAPNLNPSF